MHTTRNFKTKKELRAAVEAWVAWDEQRKLAAQMGALQFFDPEPRAVTYYQPGPFGGNEPRDGTS
jgi:spore germination cell wall hydrolase CwlJ-like protein